MKEANRHHQALFKTVAVMAALVVIAAALTARADVTIKRTSTTKGLGGLLDAEIKSVDCIQGDKSCNDAETRSTNKLMKFLAGSKPTQTSMISRLDKDLMWTVNHQDKSYTEMTFAEMRAMMDSLKGSMAGNKQHKAEIDTSEVTFAPPTFDVQKTGVKETIGGYPCEQSILTMTVEGTNKKNGEKFQMVTTMDMMLTPKVPGGEETEQFGKKMAEKMGIGMDASGAQAMMSAMGAYGIDAKKLAEEAAKMKGFPMRQIVRFMGQGKQFAANNEAASKEDSKEKEKESAEEDKSGSTDLASKALGGLFGKKKKDDKKKEEAGKPAEPPDNSIFKMTTEVTEITTDAIPSTRFEVPQGYKLKPAGKK